MFAKCLISAVALVACVGSPLVAQPTGQDVELLKLQLRQLQNQLNQITPHADPLPPNQRVTAVGNQSTLRSKRENTLTIRVYDLSDLFTVAPQYPAQYPDDVHASASRILFPNALALQTSNQANSAGGGGFGGGLGGGTFNIPPQLERSTKPKHQPSRDPFTNISFLTAQDVVSTGININLVSLAEVITETISPDDWEENGGDARIAILGNSFIINCYPSMHDKIQELFDLFRKKWGSLRTIAITAYWCRASVAEINLLTKQSQPAEPNDLGRGVSVIDRDKWAEFLTAARQSDQVTYAAAITGQNGQTVHALSGELTSYVHSSTPTVKGTKEAVVAYKSETATIHQGAAIQVTPLATRGGNFVMLDVHSRVNEIKSLRSSLGADEAGGGAAGGIEIPNFTAYRLSTTVRVPKDRVVLVGGMTFDRITADEKPELYLFVQASVHDIVLDE